MEDDKVEEVKYDHNAELRRREDEARRLLNSKPVNVPRMKKELQDAQLIKESHKENFTVI